jgi:hypothetical protein
VSAVLQELFFGSESTSEVKQIIKSYGLPKVKKDHKKCFFVVDSKNISKMEVEGVEGEEGSITKYISRSKLQIRRTKQ